MRWRWSLRKVAVSVFLVGHLSALAVWNLPICPLKTWALPGVAWYVLPTGLWQYWGMFAPNPLRSTLTVEALALDSREIGHVFAFPKMSDFSTLSRIPRVRHSKYTTNFGPDDQVAVREFAARHAVRQLKLPDDAFPVNVDLVYNITPSPPIGEAPDPMTPSRRHVIQSYRFNAPEDVRP